MSATASYYQNAGLPFLSVAATVGSNTLSEYVKSTTTLSRCRSLSFTQSGHSYVATLVSLDFPRIGARSSAYQLAFAVSGLRVVVDIVLFTSGSRFGFVEYGTLGTPDAVVVGAFAREAASKMGGKVVSAPGPKDSVVFAPAQVVTTAMGPVEYRSVGSGPVLLMIAGYASTMEIWDPRFVDALVRHYRVVIFDNAGIGSTRALASPLTIDSMADQTSALITALQLKKPDVLGWSMGGMIAQALAVRHPSQVQKLVLCATFPGTGSVAPTQSVINSLTSGNVAQSMAQLFPADQAVAQSAFQGATSAYPTGPSVSGAIVKAQAAAVLQWFNGNDPAGKLTRTITVPVLVADGTVDHVDPVVNDYALAQSIAGSRLVLYPDAGHAFLFQNVAAFVPVIENFLH